MKIKICGIYKIMSPSGKIYIGQSINIEGRWKGYKKERKNPDTLLYKSLKKYGYENHIFEVLEKCSKELLNEREIYWIKFYDTFDTSHGMNLQSGGFQNSKLSKESREKMSKARKGKFKLSEEHKEKLRLANLNRVWIRKKGIKPTKETREKMSLSQLGNKNSLGAIRSEDFKEKLRIANLGKVLSKEHREKLSNSHKGKIATEETKRKLSLAKRGKKCSESHRKNLSKSLKGRVFSEETKLKMSLSKLGVKRTPESILKREATKRRNKELKLLGI